MHYTSQVKMMQTAAHYYNFCQFLFLFNWTSFLEIHQVWLGPPG